MQQPTEKAFAHEEARPYEPPRFTVIPLDCEITAYAPTDGEPLF